MSFQDLSLLDRYNSLKQDVSREFYNPVLRESVEYCRISCYFSSASIASAAEGLTSFITRGKRMYLIVGSSLEESDVEAMNKGNLKLDDIIQKKWEDCLKISSDNMIVRCRFEALAWLLAHEILRIKIGVNVDSDGNPITSEESKFHEKMMLFEDSDGNFIQTDGSNNETRSAVYNNRENFAVHRSWVSGQAGYAEDAKEEFWDLWNNNDEYSRTYGISEALRSSIISIAPDKMPDIGDGPYVSIQAEARKLRPYQSTAIDAWFENDCRGILQMATGTGKTFTAMNIIKRIARDGMCVVITVPQKELSVQWVEECREFFDKGLYLIECNSNTQWKESFSRFIRQSEHRFSIIVCVNKTFCNELFQKGLNRIQDRVLLISDEVHEMSADKSSDVLKGLPGIRMRLGLSATPMHHWNIDRNEFLSTYFGDVIYEWNLHEAIHPPSGIEPCLVPYAYNVECCSLSIDELLEYLDISNKISKHMGKIHDDDGGRWNDKEDPELQRLLFKRANIVQSCVSRFDVLRSVISQNAGVLNKCIIYCRNISEIDRIARILSEMGYDAVKFHSRKNDQARADALDSFKRGTSRFIIAVGCLDQGVDIPNCDSAIIMSSSKNPREYVQRRGRVLRLNGPDKVKATIFDIFVLPYELEDMMTGKWNPDSVERNMMKSQLDRIDEFVRDSDNRLEMELRLEKLRQICGA